ncbi:MAG: rfaE bifunctional protein nucleotidyltransferase chain/domain [Cyclobacteriaceae bacterium]|jgi:rfaE bifunctional protein nucleotidyltransferase chain/domain
MSSQAKIVSVEEAQKQVQAWKSEGLQIVFTNGCFDILHLGHVDYLEKSSGLGDKLVLGLNTDQSVSAIKGENRPLQNQLSRSRVIAALTFVDLVVLFDESTPRALIESIVPNILVKGDDYEIKNIVGADFVLANGGKVETVSLVTGYSTTSVVNKILKK